MNFKRSTLIKVNFLNLIRLANYLKLHTDSMSHRQVASLIIWRLHKNRMWH